MSADACVECVYKVLAAMRWELCLPQVQHCLHCRRELAVCASKLYAVQFQYSTLSSNRITIGLAPVCTVLCAMFCLPHVKGGHILPASQGFQLSCLQPLLPVNVLLAACKRRLYPACVHLAFNFNSGLLLSCMQWLQVMGWWVACHLVFVAEIANRQAFLRTTPARNLVGPAHLASALNWPFGRFAKVLDIAFASLAISSCACVIWLAVLLHAKA